MANYGSKYSSECVSKERMIQICGDLPNVLKDVLGEATCEVMYGFGSGLFPDLCYKPMTVPQKLMESFVQDSVRQEIFLPGESDLCFESPDGGLKLTLGHECDMLINGSDDELIGRFVAHDAFKDIEIYSQMDLREKYPESFKKSAAYRKEFGDSDG